MDEWTNSKLDKSCISNPKSQIGLVPSHAKGRVEDESNLRFRDFGFEMQDLSNFEFVHFRNFLR
jgi:hypothetical protein